jgi:hypothetical protein
MKGETGGGNVAGSAALLAATRRGLGKTGLRRRVVAGPALEIQAGSLRPTEESVGVLQAKRGRRRRRAKSGHFRSTM